MKRLLLQLSNGYADNSMNTTQHFFFCLLRHALAGSRLTSDDAEQLRTADWQAIYQMAARQGLLAVLWDVVAQLPKECLPPRELKLRWALSAEGIAERYGRQRAVAAELAERWSEAGLRPFVLKGFAVSRYYPVPEHRECGDFDCFLGEGRDVADKVAAEAGAWIEEPVGYKHTHIRYKKVVIENHRFCIAVRGNRQAKAFERLLESLLADDPQPEYVEATRIGIPPVLFNALFLAWHGLTHFLLEGIRFRHVYDWACFVEAEQERLDWGRFYAVCEQYHLRRFVDAMTAMAVRWCGVRIANPAVVTESPYADRILDSIFYDDSAVYNRGKGRWWGRTKVLSNIFRYQWKYRDIYQRSYVGQMAKLVGGFLFDRHPKL